MYSRFCTPAHGGLSVPVENINPFHGDNLHRSVLIARGIFYNSNTLPAGYALIAIGFTVTAAYAGAIHGAHVAVLDGGVIAIVNLIGFAGRKAEKQEEQKRKFTHRRYFF